ncbi:DDE-type integrase/transposase/recombinase [Sphingobium limneticum]|jgi:transposase InsO family protein|uniref:DDE-type integrase/transposase/recombinase n=1 Tax=Alphaproteobacteria TaxID=28211 RepID=UPI0012E360B6
MVWVADFTYIRITVGFCYLAVILDACSRKVIGYGLSKRLDTPLALAALRSAIENRKAPPGCIHHTDRRCQGRFNRLPQHPNMEVFIVTGRRKSEQSTRQKLSSPGRPPVWQRENLCRFWREIAAGLSARMPLWKPASLPLLGTGDFGGQVACLPHICRPQRHYSKAEA